MAIISKILGIVIYMKKWLIGVDEVGRGPLAGPVSVGVACVSDDFNWELLPGVTDSKRLTQKRREAIHRKAQQLKKDGLLTFAVASVSASSIDTVGIVSAVQRAMDRALRTIEHEDMKYEEILIRLDGGLKAPERYLHQETIIKGDAKEKVIGLASIVAKVTRDRYMERLSEHAMYAPYCFHQHKGYGTERHRELILTLGMTDMHRKSYCQKLMGG